MSKQDFQAKVIKAMWPFPLDPKKGTKLHDVWLNSARRVDEEFLPNSLFVHTVPDPSYEPPETSFTSTPSKPNPWAWPAHSDLAFPDTDDTRTHEEVDAYIKLMNSKNGEFDPNGKSPNTPGAKLDAGKDRPWLCIAGFSRALSEVAKVTTIGAHKYTPNGWAQVENGEERYMDAFGRHMMALGKGEIFDAGENGTGCYHKAQMIWNLLASLELEMRNERN